MTSRYGGKFIDTSPNPGGVFPPANILTRGTNPSRISGSPSPAPRYGDVFVNIPPGLEGVYLPSGRSEGIGVNPSAIFGGSSSTAAATAALTATAGQNLGSCSQIYAGTTPGGLMQFRTLCAGAGLAAVQGANTITLSSSGAYTVSNDTSGVGNVGLVENSPASGNVLLKSLATGTGITLSNPDPHSVEITNSGVTSVVNDGTAPTPFYNLIEDPGEGAITVKTLRAGANVMFADNGNYLTVSASAGGPGVIQVSNDTTDAGSVGLVEGSPAMGDVVLQSLLAGTNINLASNGHSVTVSTVATGSVTGGTSEGSGATVFNAGSSTATTLAFNSLVSGSTGLTVSNGPAGEITIANTGATSVTNDTTDAGSVGLVEGSPATGAVVLQSLLAGTNINLASNGNSITVSTIAAGSVTGGISEGSGATVFDAGNSTATTLAFRSLVSGGSGLTVLNGPAGEITITNVGVTSLTNDATDAGSVGLVEGSPATGAAVLQSLLAGTNINLASDGHSVTVSTVATGSVTSGTSEGSGATVFNAGSSTATTLAFNSLVSGGAGLTVSNGPAGEITITNTGVTNVTNDTTDAGSVGLVEGSPATGAVVLQSLLAGTNINLASNGNSVTVSTIAAGSVTGGTSEGSGATVFDAGNSTATTLAFRSLVSGGAGLTVLNGPAGEITVTNTGVTSLTNDITDSPAMLYHIIEGSSPATGAVNVKTLEAGTNITIADDNHTLTITAAGSGSVTGGTSEGSGAMVFDAGNSTATTLAFRSLVSGGAGLTVSNGPAGEITITNTGVTSLTNDITDVGTLYNIIEGNSPVTGAVNVKTLEAGANITIGDDTHTLTITAAGSVTGGTSEGSGATVFDAGNSTTSTLAFRSLVSGGAGLTVLNGPAGEITITNTGVTSLTNDITDSPATLYRIIEGNSPVTGAVNVKTLEAGTNITIADDTHTLTITAAGSVTGGTSEGSGATVFDAGNSTTSTLAFRSLVSGGAGLTVLNGPAGEITITNTGVTSLTNDITDSPATLYRIIEGNSPVTGAVNVKTLEAGTNITIADDTHTLTITAAGSVTGGISEGSGAMVFDAGNSTASTLAFRSLVSGGAGLTVSNGPAGAITIANTGVTNVTNDTTDAGSVGLVEGSPATGAVVLQSLLAGTNINLASNGNSVTVSTIAAGSVTGGSSEGSGATVFDAGNSTATTLAFRSLISGGSGLTVSNGPVGEITIANTGVTNVTNDTTDAGSVGLVEGSPATGAVVLQSLLAGTNINLASNGNSVTVSTIAAGSVTGGSSEGSGATVFDAGNSTATTLAFRSLISGGSGLTVSNGPAGEITITNAGVTSLTNDITDVGTLYNIIEGNSPVTGAVNIKTLEAGTNVTIADDGHTLTIGATGGTGTVTGGTSEGSGATVFDAGNSTATTLAFRSLISGGAGLTVSNGPAGEITITNTGVTSLTNDITDVGTLYNIIEGNSPVTGAVNVKTLEAGANITIADDTHTLTITAAGSVTGGTSEGSGATVFDAGNSTASTLAFRSLISGGSGLTVSNGPTGEITITNSGVTSLTNDITDVGTLYNIIEGTSPVTGAVNVKTLEAGTNITIADDTHTLTITAAGSVTGGTSEGSGTGQVFDAGNSTATTLAFRSLISGGSGLTVSNGPTGEITITNSGVTSLTNDITDVGTLYNIIEGTSPVTGAVNVKTLEAGTNITIADDGHTLTIGATGGTGTVTGGTSEGSGTGQVFDAGNSTATTLAFRSLISGGSGLTVSNGPTGEITITNAGVISLTNDITDGGTLYNIIEGTSPVTGAVNVKTMKAGTNVTIGDDTHTLTITAAGSVTGGTSEGSGTGQVFDAGNSTATTLAFRSLISGGSGLTVSNGPTGEITITNAGVISLTNDITDGGTLYNIIEGTSPVTGAVNVKTMKAGTNVTIGDDTHTLTITAAGSVTGGTSEGSGTGQVFDAGNSTATTLAFRSLISGGSGLTVSNGPTGEITITNAGVISLTNDITDGGTLYNIIEGTSPVTGAVNVKTMKAGTNVTIGDDTHTLTITAAGSVTGGTSEGSGTGQVFDAGNSTATTLAFRSLISGGSGLTVSNGPTGEITITNSGVISLTNDITDGGTLYNIIEGTSPVTGAVNVKTLKAGTNMTIGDDGHTLTITAGITGTLTLGTIGTVAGKMVLNSATASGGSVSLTVGSMLAAAAYTLTWPTAAAASPSALVFNSAGTGSFRAPNVQQGTLATTFSTGNTTFTSTGLTASITLSTTTSKVQIQVTGTLGNVDSGYTSYATIYRGATNLGNTDGFVSYVPSSINAWGPCAMIYIDSPASTSALTYTVQIQTASGGSATWNLGTSLSTIVLTEIFS